MRYALTSFNPPWLAARLFPWAGPADARPDALEVALNRHKALHEQGTIGYIFPRHAWIIGVAPPGETGE